jgi:hypothetical protein
LVLDTIPKQFASPERQAQYRPLAAIKPGYLPARIQETFPAVRPPDPVEE